jgi:protein-S-isoprenylcysteine O-methyltransferase Ste14
MGRYLVIVVFGLMAVALGAETVHAFSDAISGDAANRWLAVVYSVLKLTVAISFTVFVIKRAPARRRSRDPVAYIACAAAVLPAALQGPTESASAGMVLAGELITVLGCAWMLVAALALGRCFGVLPEVRGLVTHGPYRLVRHPLYLGEFGAMGGLLIASPSPRNLAAGAIFVVAQATRMRFEERALTNEFPEYAAYALATPRVIPSPGIVVALAAGRWSTVGGVDRAARAPAPAGEAGQTLMEYVLILGFCSIVGVFLMTVFGVSVAQMIADVASTV